MSVINGVVVGLVTRVDDPRKLGRIKVHFPWLDEKHETDWVRIATMMAGGDRGSFFMPEVNDEVLVAFEHGDARFPFVVGFLWNGQDKPPAKDVRDRILKSKNGHQIRFLDSTPSGGSKGALVIEDAHGNRITMSNAKIMIKSTATLQLDAPSVVIQGKVKGKGYKRVIAPNNNDI
jgi:phage baseplate assembly protein V